MLLKAGSQVDVEIQFQMNRLLFSQMLHALDLLTSVDIIFPDLSKVAKFMATKRKTMSAAALVCS